MISYYYFEVCFLEVNVKKLLLLIIFLLFNICYSHPHMFVTPSIEIVFDKDGIAGFQQQWIFDDMFSSSIIADFDKNRDGKLSKSEIKVIEKDAFSYTSEQDYFTRLKEGDKKIPLKRVTKFNAWIKDGVLVYSFFLPHKIALSKKNTKIVLAVYDSTYYVAFDFKSVKDLTYKNAENYNYKAEMYNNTSKKYYYGQIAPLEFIINVGKK